MPSRHQISSCAHDLNLTKTDFNLEQYIAVLKNTLSKGIELNVTLALTDYQLTLLMSIIDGIPSKKSLRLTLNIIDVDEIEEISAQEYTKHFFINLCEKISKITALTSLCIEDNELLSSAEQIALAQNIQSLEHLTHVTFSLSNLDSIAIALTNHHITCFKVTQFNVFEDLMRSAENQTGNKTTKYGKVTQKTIQQIIRIGEVLTANQSLREVQFIADILAQSMIHLDITAPKLDIERAVLNHLFVPLLQHSSLETLTFDLLRLISLPSLNACETHIHAMIKQTPTNRLSNIQLMPQPGMPGFCQRFKIELTALTDFINQQKRKRLTLDDRSFFSYDTRSSKKQRIVEEAEEKAVCSP